MSRRAAHLEGRHFFGDQFDLLSEKVVDADPAERANALRALETYLDDCIRPIDELKKQIAAARIHADRECRNGPRPSQGSMSTTGARVAPTRTQSLSEREKTRARIEALVAAAPD